MSPAKLLESDSLNDRIRTILGQCMTLCKTFLNSKYLCIFFPTPKAHTGQNLGNKIALTDGIAGNVYIRKVRECDILKSKMQGHVFVDMA